MFNKLLSYIDKGEPFRRDEFRLIDWKQREYIRGNFVAFGFWSGLKSNITLLSPLMNLILNFKYRHMHLTFADPETGKELDPLTINAIVCRIKEK